MRTLVIGLFGMLLLTACRQEEHGTAKVEDQSVPETITLTSPAFANRDAIPSQYSCQGDEISPPLVWNHIPDETQSFALIMDDPDASRAPWIHWVIYNIPSDTRNLPEAVNPVPGIVGKNSWDRTSYGGPCPPAGTHRYFFHLYALDILLDLDPGATQADLAQAMEGRMLARGELMGTYHK
jgi:Raf kinase inhibitor-like YbhB/YbcL family protein